MTVERLLGTALAAALLLSGAALAADSLSALSTSVSGVLSDALVLAEQDHGVANTRVLKVGQEYRDGWVLTAVSDRAATLKKGRESRIVPFTVKAPSALQPAPSASAPAAKGLNLSNAGSDALKPIAARPAADPAKIRAAVTAGDPRAAYAAGGSAQDVASALASAGNLPPGMADMIANGANVSYVNMGGRTGLTFGSPDSGRVGIIVPPQLADTSPPPDAPVATPPPIPPGAQVSSDGNRTVIRVPAPGQ